MNKYVIPAIVSIFLIQCSSGLLKNELPNYDKLTAEEARQPEYALASFNVHPELGLQLFASEPMLINPTNIDVDERGRVWVCEAQNYRGFRNDHPQRVEGDRILILEDIDGDGQADQTKVFYQGPDVNSALGIAKLGNRVYVAASPHMLVFTDLDGDDMPDNKDTLFTGLEGVDHDHGVHAIVFGPDGKLYFNYGNEGKRLRLKSGEIAVDRYGNRVEEGEIFRQGMIFRCNADGSDLEVMAHNFRNNYEVAVDAYGAMWQSDNDDDGNQATRINFVMDYGNYGFTDQMTGAGWRTPRIGMHEEIPKRHWHLNDPGVVPNLLQTGAGSPTGMLIYEGRQLPEVLWGQMIHCEPGKNVVRAYPVQDSGAGYIANILPLIRSADGWFRPSDVCSAPDGSLMISDWYDEGVGGHLMADIKRGRIYRLHSSTPNYKTEKVDLSNVELAAKQLNHPNQATRYLAYQAVKSNGTGPEVLKRLINASEHVGLKARMYWCLASIPSNNKSTIHQVFAEKNPNLRMAALRMSRQFLNEPDQLQLLTDAVQDQNEGVLREAAISLRFLDGDKVNHLWNVLATKYNGADRWYLEALGIGSDLYADSRASAYLAFVKEKNLKPSPDIIWRLRSSLVLPDLYELIQTAQAGSDLTRYFRAMHFLPTRETEKYLVRALQDENLNNPQEVLLAALSSIKPETIKQNPAIHKIVTESLPIIRGSDTWAMLVRNARLKSETPILLDSALQSGDENFRSEAIKLVVELDGYPMIKERFNKADLNGKLALVDLASHIHTKVSRRWLGAVLQDLQQETLLRHRAAKALSQDWNGMEQLMNRLEAGEFDARDAEVISLYLSQAWRNDVRQRAIAWMKANKGYTPINLQDLANKKGNAQRGKLVFEKYCLGCHQVNGGGINFGPDLSLIGDKLDKNALLSAIVYPSLGIGFGYEGFSIETNDGKKYNGFIESQTENEIRLRMMGGLSQSIQAADIEKKEPMAESLMTENLHELMTEEELANLLEYLHNLKKHSEM